MLKPLTIAARKTRPDDTHRMDLELTSREAGKLLGALHELFKTRGLWADDVPLVSKLMDFHSTVNDDLAFYTLEERAIEQWLDGRTYYVLALPRIYFGEQDFIGGKAIGTKCPVNAKRFLKPDHAEKFAKDNGILGTTVRPIGRKVGLKVST
jgi:hypothetical protein